MSRVHSDSTPIRAAAVRARRSASPNATPRARSPKVSSSPTESAKNCDSGSCMSVPATRPTAPSPARSGSNPATRTVPRIKPPVTFGMTPLTTESSVDFPEPECPVTSTTRPGSSVRLMSSKTFFSWSYAKSRCSMRINGSVTAFSNLSWFVVMMVTPASPLPAPSSRPTSATPRPSRRSRETPPGGSCASRPRRADGASA